MGTLKEKHTGGGDGTEVCYGNVMCEMPINTQVDMLSRYLNINLEFLKHLGWK